MLFQKGRLLFHLANTPKSTSSPGRGEKFSELRKECLAITFVLPQMPRASVYPDLPDVSVILDSNYTFMLLFDSKHYAWPVYFTENYCNNRDVLQLVTLKLDQKPF